MTHIDYGLSVLATATVLDRIPGDTVVDLADVFAEMSDRGELAGYEVRERFYEIGSADGMDDLERLLSERSGAG
jgi:NDP-sugar pyrophosphorylase family protein